MNNQKARLSESPLVSKQVRMISQKARLAEGPFVRKSDNNLIKIITSVNNLMTNYLSLFINLCQ